MTDFYLAYHGSNSENAVAISSRLEKSNYKVSFIPIMGEAGPYLSERLITLKRPIILLISDNFLKSTICMYDALSALRNLLKDELIYPVIVPGNYGKGADNQKVKTQFSKVSHVLGYMSYWKDIYIDTRKEKRPFLDADKKQYNQKLQELKSIQSEAGEYIRQLRDIEHIRFEDIIASDYELLYKFLSKQRYVHVDTLDSTPGSSLPLNQVETTEDQVEEKSKIEQIIEHQAQTSPDSQLTEADGFIEVKNIELDLSNGFSEEMISDKPLTDVVIPLEANDAPNVDLSKKKATIVDSETAEYDHTNEIIKDSIEIFEAGQYEAGYMFLEDYLKYNPTNVEVRMHLANMRYDFGDKDLAADDMQYILKIDDSNIQAHKWVAEYYEINNQPKKALHHLLRVQIQEPDSYDIDYRLGLLLKNHIKDLSSAKSYFESALKKNPEDAKSLFQLGLLKKEQGDDLGSKEYLEKTLESDNEAIESDYELAKIFMKADDLEKVKHHWALAVDQDFDLYDPIISAYLEENENIYLDVQTANSETDLEDDLKQVEELSNLEVPPTASVGDDQHSSIIDTEFEHSKIIEESGQAIEAGEKSIQETVEVEQVDDLEPVTEIEINDIIQVIEEDVDLDYRKAKMYLLEDNFEKVQHHWSLALAANPTLEDPIITAYISQNERANVVDSEEKVESEVISKVDDIVALPKIDLTPIEPIQVTEQEDLEEVALDNKDVIVESDYELAKFSVLADNPEMVKHHWALALADEPTLEDPVIAAYLAKQKKKQKQKERLESIRKSVESDLIQTEVKKKKKKKKSGKIKTILITGATAGIGRATALRLAKQGHRLILTGRRLEKLQSLAAEIKKAKVKLLNFDVRDYDAARDAIASLNGKWANIDILINNAGLAQGKDPIHEADVEDWNTMLDTNVKGILHMTRLIAPSMVYRRKGQIINVCSTAGHEAYPGGSVYCASKFAVRALTKGMRMDLHKYNVRVCQVSPGAVEETEFSKVRFHGDEEKAKIYEDFTPVNSRDIAKIIEFMITRPRRVNIEDVLVMSTQQASATIIDKSGRKNG